MLYKLSISFSPIVSPQENVGPNPAHINKAPSFRSKVKLSNWFDKYYYANIFRLKTPISHVKSWNFKIETTLITQVGRLEVLTRLRWRSNNHESRRFRSTIWALQVLRSQCNQGTHCTSEKSLLSWEVLAFNAEAVWSASAKTHLSSCKPTKKTRSAEANWIWVGKDNYLRPVYKLSTFAYLSVSFHSLIPSLKSIIGLYTLMVG